MPRQKYSKQWRCTRQVDMIEADMWNRLYFSRVIESVVVGQVMIFQISKTLASAKGLFASLEAGWHIGQMSLNQGNPETPILSVGHLKRDDVRCNLSMPS